MSEHRCDAYGRTDEFLYLQLEGDSWHCDVCEVHALRTALAQSHEKWQTYERDYILPAFVWANEIGLDLQAVVLEHPGKNCIELLVEHLRTALAAERAKREQAEEAVDEMSLELRALRRVHLHGCDCSEDEACMFARERDAEHVRAERAEKELDELRLKVGKLCAKAIEARSNRAEASMPIGVLSTIIDDLHDALKTTDS